MNEFYDWFGPVTDFSEDGFIASDFDSDVFNEDKIYELLEEMHKEDITIRVANHGIEGMSRLIVHDFEHNVATAGSVDTDVPDYYIIPDYVPSEIVNQDYLSYLAATKEKKNFTFRVPPVANPIIPTGKEYNYESERTLEQCMIARGALILGATPGQRANKKISNTKCVDVASIDYDAGLMYFDRYNLWVPNLEIPETNKSVFIQTDFNPFNPNSLRFILCAEWESYFVLVGVYKFKDKEYNFRFNLKDKRFRIHSDQWLSSFSGIDRTVRHFYETLDLVSWQDFASQLGIQESSMPIQPVVIEPLVSNRSPSGPYSIIGPWVGRIDRGLSEYLRTPYTTHIYHKPDNEAKKYDMCMIDDINYLTNQITFYFEGKLNAVNMKAGEIDHPDIYMYAMNSGNHIFVPSPKGEYLFYPTNIMYRAFPRNLYGSIIYRLDCMPFIHALTDIMRGTNFSLMDKWGMQKYEGVDDFEDYEHDRDLSDFKVGPSYFNEIVDDRVSKYYKTVKKVKIKEVNESLDKMKQKEAQYDRDKEKKLKKLVPPWKIYTNDV